MGRQPTKAKDNVYCKARKEAALYDERLKSREGAAEMLGLHPSTLADYELGNTKVMPVDKVVLMSDLYNAPELKNHYCKYQCPIGADKDIATEIKGIQDIVINMLYVLNAENVAVIENRLIDIAKDGKVNEDEKEDLNNILSLLSELTAKIEELRLLYEKETK